MKINKFDNSDTLISALADFIESSIKELLTHKAEICFAVSGGKSPIPLFTELSTRKLEWNRVIITLVDERFVVNTHEDSNEKLVCRYLLQNEASIARFIGLAWTDLGIEQSCKLADKQVPQIDMAILGMGEDGHTASIFPCCPELSAAIDSKPNLNNRYIITSPVTASHSRIGLTLNAILSIPRLILSINGNSKLTILEKAYISNSSSLPIGLVLNSRPDTQIFWFK